MEDKYPEIVDEERDVLLLDCDCGSADHMIKIVYDRDWPSETGCLVIGVQMRQWRGFFKRLVLGVKYIFRQDREKWSHWDTCIVRHEDLPRFKELIKKFEETGVESGGPREI